MATYYSNRVNANGTHYIRKEQGLTTDFCVATDASTALVLNDVIKLFTIPKDAIITGLIFGGTARNSGNDRTVIVGDASDTDRLIAGGAFFRDSNTFNYNWVGGHSTVNHSGTGSSVVITRGMGYKYTADTDLILTVSTAGTGNAADWVLTCAVQYFIQG